MKQMNLFFIFAGYEIGPEIHERPSSRTTDRIQCPQCDKTFTMKVNMKRHLKFIHSDNKPFTCDICLKSFNRKENMKSHKLAMHF